MTETDWLDPAWREAREYVIALRGLYIHAIVFATVLAALFAIDLATGPDWWAHWVLLGWGIGMAAHVAAVVLRFALFDADWENQRIRRRLARRAAPR